MLSYFQSIVMGLLQGITELFPVSSLGHSLIFPTLFGWDNLVQAQADKESFFLAFLVGLHLATAIALIIFYRNEWVRIAQGFFSSIKNRKTSAPNERLAWLLVIATIPTAIVGLLFEHSIRVFFARPIYASVFLIVNGVLLFAGERLSRKKSGQTDDGSFESTNRNLETLKYRDAALIGTFQIGALFAGISRAGITLIGGLFRGLNHQDAARFSFLLATPIILLAGLYKIPDLLGPNGHGVRMQILVGSLVAGIAAYLSVKFLDKYFQNRKTTPFAVYCVVLGAAMVIKIVFF